MRLIGKKRHYMVLIEVIISLSLTMFILSVLLFMYSQLTKIGTILESYQEKSFEVRYLENRLAEVLPKSLEKNTKTKKPYFYFFTSDDPGQLFKGGNPSLIFTFDNGVSMDKAFSFRTVGRLYLDPEGNLMLGLWPSPKLWKETEPPPMKKQLLLSGVSKIEFFFFVSPKTDWKPVDAKADYNNSKKLIPEEHYGKWIPDWKKEYNQLPQMIKLIITRTVEGKEEKIQFVYPLPDNTQKIVYEL